mgnify:CR=1 FL=1
MKDNTIPLTLISILADGEFHSGEQLGEQLGMSRAAINKHIQTCLLSRRSATGALMCSRFPEKATACRSLFNC